MMEFVKVNLGIEVALWVMWSPAFDKDEENMEEKSEYFTVYYKANNNDLYCNKPPGGDPDLTVSELSRCPSL